jgi:cell division inhibitor SepF
MSEFPGEGDDLNMSTVWRRALIYLGLAGDDEYEYLERSEEGSDSSSAAKPRKQQASGATAPRSDTAAGTIRGQKQPTGDVERLAAAEARLQREQARSGAPPQKSPVGQRQGVHATPAVRPVKPAATAKPHVVTPASFEDAQQVGDRFKANQPVIMNLQNVPRDLARRLIDFASGLCYGLDGGMEKVASHVYLLTPPNVQVSDEDRKKIRERGLGSV